MEFHQEEYHFQVKQLQHPQLGHGVVFLDADPYPADPFVGCEGRDCREQLVERYARLLVLAFKMRHSSASWAVAA